MIFDYLEILILKILQSFHNYFEKCLVSFRMRLFKEVDRIPFIDARAVEGYFTGTMNLIAS